MSKASPRPIPEICSQCMDGKDSCRARLLRAGWDSAMKRSPKRLSLELDMIAQLGGLSGGQGSVCVRHERLLCTIKLHDFPLIRMISIGLVCRFEGVQRNWDGVVQVQGRGIHRRPEMGINICRSTTTARISIYPVQTRPLYAHR